MQRFPPAASLQARISGGMAVAAGRGDAGRRLLQRATELAERQGARVELARACEALALARPEAAADVAAAARAATLWTAMGVQAPPAPTRG